MSIKRLAQTLQCNQCVMLENAKPIRHHGDISAKTFVQCIRNLYKERKESWILYVLSVSFNTPRAIM